MKKLLSIVCAATCLTLSAGQALAQAYPTKPIKIIVPFGPGGFTDVVARILGVKLGESLGQSIVIENKPGAGSMIGTDQVAKSAPDGHTLLIGGLATHAASPNMLKADYDPLKDFESVGMIGSAPIIAITFNESPFKTLKDVVDAARKDPKGVMYGTSGNGSPLHLAGELFTSQNKIDMTHVPYKGGVPAITDTIGGQTQLMFPSLFTALPYIKSGKLNGLAIAGAKRSSVLPNVPTLKEQGIDGVDVEQWYGFFAPAKTPKETIAKLNQSLNKALADPEIIKRLEGHGADVESSSPEQLGDLVKKDLAK